MPDISSRKSTDSACGICGVIRGLDQHHVIPRRMGGTRDPDIHDESNLMTLCRSCHRNIHEGRWELIRSDDRIRVVDKDSGEEVARRFRNPGVEIPPLFEILNLAQDSLSQLHAFLPYLTDDQLVEAFGYACSFGKRSWLIQAAILYEAQQRSTYGERTLEAIGRRFEIGLRQAQKYALVWKVFFTNDGEAENVNIDAIILDEPSWYVVAVTETQDPENWLAYAQDRKMEDSRYSVAAFRRDIRVARLTQAIGESKVARGEEVGLPQIDGWACPWIKLLCIRSGKPVPVPDCVGCEVTSEGRLSVRITVSEGEDAHV